MFRSEHLQRVAPCLLLGLLGLFTQASAAGKPVRHPIGPGATRAAAGVTASPLIVLGRGDDVSMQVFGQPDMDSTLYIADDGTVRVPLLRNPVKVAGLSPPQAARKIEVALERGGILVSPHVALKVVNSRSQKVSILGQVRSPGSYVIDSNTTLFRLLSEAGGPTASASDAIDILRAGPNGKIRHLTVDLQGLANPETEPDAAEIKMKGGDQVYVPPAPPFYVGGEVHAPAQYLLKHPMTVLQAIYGAGGITEMGSADRVVVKRRGPNGHYRVISAKMTDDVEPNDVIIVKERIF
jgi:polysaccharide biosynthesis/export protein